MGSIDKRNRSDYTDRAQSPDGGILLDTGLKSLKTLCQGINLGSRAGGAGLALMLRMHRAAPRQV